MKQKIYLTAAVCLLCLSQAQAQTFNINTGSNIVITANGTYTITGNGSPTINTIKVNSGVVADITLENVNIDVSGIENACAFEMSGATVTLRLSGTNTLKSGANAAGLHAPEGATLTITSISGNGSTEGTLSATGGYGGAGIGGSDGGGYYWDSGGVITISGGVVNATGGIGSHGGAAIGGGYGGSGGTISITGGVVNATGGECSAGIGGGEGGSSSTISITGGTINATGGTGNAGDITISGGTVIAVNNAGSGIGAGSNYTGGSISISGGTVIATGKGIGIGESGKSIQTTINGNPVIFATAINGKSSEPENGIATGGNIITPSATVGTITLRTDFTVPAGATLTIPAGWTLNHTNYSLTINGTIINHGTIIPPPVTGVSLNKNIVNLYVGESETLTATASPDNVTNAAVIWSSNNESVATVNNGLVHAVGEGSALITATSIDDNGIADSCWVTVSKKLQSITGFNVNPKTYGDEPFTLQAHATSGLPVRYESNNPAVASISDSTVTITGAGSAIITATQDGDAEYLAATASITLLVNKANQSIIGFLPTDTAIFLGAHINLAAISSSGLEVSYESNNLTVARIEGNLITAVGLGTTVITANQAGDNNYNPAPALTCTLTVVYVLVPVTDVSLNEHTLGLLVGESETLTATVSPNNATNPAVIWSSNNASVATVNNGLVHAVGEGSAWITAATSDYDSGIADSCLVTVTGATGISTVDESSSVTVGFSDCSLSINSPAAEQIEVYTLSGKLLHRASKPAGKASFTVSNSERVLIVRGSSGWVKKIEDR